MARSSNGGGAGPSKKHSLIRSGKNRLSKKYERQRRRTEANKLARAAAHAARNPNDQTPGKGTA